MPLDGRRAIPPGGTKGDIQMALIQLTLGDIEPRPHRRTASVTPDQFRAALTKLHLTQTLAGQLLAAHPRTVRRWSWGEREIPTTVAMLVWLLLTDKVSYQQLEWARQMAAHLKVKP
jgi:GAF domain-containing protein